MRAAFISTFFRPAAFPVLRALSQQRPCHDLNRCLFVTPCGPGFDYKSWRCVQHGTRRLCSRSTTTTSQLDATSASTPIFVSSSDSTNESVSTTSTADTNNVHAPSTSTSSSNNNDESDALSMFATDTTFKELGLSQATADRLKKCGLHTPTKAQAVVIPVLLKGLGLQVEYATRVRTGVQQACEAHIEQMGGDSQLDRNTKLDIEENFEAEERPDVDVDDLLMFAAETGSGKTLAYLAPFIEVAQREMEVPLKAIILLPTRELCNQVSSFIHSYFSDNGKLNMIGASSSDYVSGGASNQESTYDDNDDQQHLLPCARHVVLSGGEPSYLSYNKGDVRIVLATPATLLQHLRMSEKVTSMSDKYIVVDEADMLLQGAFLKDVERILNQLGMKPFATRRNSRVRARNANRLIFVGATFPHWVGTRVRSIVTWMKQRYPTMRAIQTPSVHRRSSRLQSRWYHLPNENDRLNALKKVLLSSDKREESLSPDSLNGDDDVSMDAEEKVMVFCGKADTAVRVTEMLRSSGQILDKYNGVTELHKLIPTSQRKLNLRDFLDGNARILVCTDLASRGLHLGHVERIIEFDFASNVVTYLHRIGRTARAGATGSTEHFYDDVSKPLAEAIREKAETEATVVESIFSRNRSFRRKFKKKMQLTEQEQPGHDNQLRSTSITGESVVSASTASSSVSMTDVEIDDIDEAERQRWNQ